MQINEDDNYLIGLYRDIADAVADVDTTYRNLGSGDLDRGDRDLDLEIGDRRSWTTPRGGSGLKLRLRVLDLRIFGCDSEREGSGITRAGTSGTVGTGESKRQELREGGKKETCVTTTVGLTAFTGHGWHVRKGDAGTVGGRKSCRVGGGGKKKTSRKEDFWPKRRCLSVRSCCNCRRRRLLMSLWLLLGGRTREDVVGVTNVKCVCSD